MKRWYLSAVMSPETPIVRGMPSVEAIVHAAMTCGTPLGVVFPRPAGHSAHGLHLVLYQLTFDPSVRYICAISGDRLTL